MKPSVPSPPRRLSRSYSGQWVNGDLQAAVLLIFVAGFLLIVAVESFYNDVFRRAPATMIPCGPELPTAMALLRARAASQLFAGGMLALTQPLSTPAAVLSMQPRRHAKRHQPPGGGFVILPWRLGFPELAHTKPEEFFVRDLLPRVSGRRQLVIDVGANTGQFALTMARNGHDGIAFEPAPSTCTELKANIDRERINGTDLSRQSNVTVHCAAVGPSRGSMPLRVGTANATAAAEEKTSASFGLASASDIAAARDPIVRVPQVTLDEMVPESATPLLLKSDTQGFEMAVLEGATNLLRRRAARLLLLELSNKLLRDAGASPRQVLDLVSDAGYDCTMLAFWGPYISEITGTLRFKTMPLPHEYLCRTNGVLSFEEVSDFLARPVGETNRTGWTDLLCWPAAELDADFERVDLERAYSTFEVGGLSNNQL